MVDRRRHAPTARRLAITPADRPRAIPHAYRGRSYKSLKDIYDADHAESRQGGRFRWLISTCLAGAVGAVAILVVVYGSSDPIERPRSLIPSLKRSTDPVPAPGQASAPPRDGGLRWAIPKSDKLQIAAGAMSTRYVIHESLKKKRNGREYIEAKPYVRIVARLAPVPANYADVIPPFNPYKLYGGAKPTATAEEDGDGRSARADISVKVVELLGGILPGEDGQELDSQEVTEIIERTKAEEALDARARGEGNGTEGATAPVAGVRPQEALPPNTTVLPRSSSEAEEPVEDIERREVRVIKAARGDTLTKILLRSGADTLLARSMVEAAKNVLSDHGLAQGWEIHITLVPSLIDPNRLEPARFSVFTEGHEHKITLYRTPSGEFVASATPLDESEAARVAEAASDKPQTTSLYASVYVAGLMQNIGPDVIQTILRVHASDTDFRRRIRAGDSVELFFDSREDGASDGPPGELLYTSITAGGDTSHFYRFRTPDGVVDYYDDQGNNSKKFLMRKPIRGEDVRLTSGFGFRFHPLLNERKMHTGIDWSAPPGTPILASGTGAVEEAQRKGYNGNYIRIRHANGYHTAYSHMQRFAPGIAPGSKVRQGQLIGFVGTTGLSTGPHLHFEVLINNRFVDPLSIQVPRERQLTGKQLADFLKERARIDDLMHRSPVLVQNK